MMARVPRGIIYIALLLMQMQIFLPLIVPGTSQEISNTAQSVYDVQHNTAATAVPYFEKEEKEVDFSNFANHKIQLLDLAVHTNHLTASHSEKINYSNGETSYKSNSPLFTVLCTFII
jgi:hypothetical protein